jgi:hypothetical protein
MICKSCESKPECPKCISDWAKQEDGTWLCPVCSALEISGCKHEAFLSSIAEDLKKGGCDKFYQDMINKHLFVEFHNGKDYCNCKEAINENQL